MVSAGVKVCMRPHDNVDDTRHFKPLKNFGPIDNAKTPKNSSAKCSLMDIGCSDSLSIVIFTDTPLKGRSEFESRNNY